MLACRSPMLCRSRLAKIMNFAFSVTAGPKGAQNAHRKGGDSAHREFHVSFAAIGAERSWAAAAETQSLDRLPMPLSAGIPLSAARAGAIAAWLLLPIVVAVGLGGVGWSRTALVTFLW